MNNAIKTVFLSGILILLFFLLRGVGLFCYHIEIDRHAYWPDMGYGLTKTWVWHNLEVIYLDEARFQPAKVDSIEKVD